MSKPETITIDEVKYIRADSVSHTPTGNIRIIILQRGWNAIGYFSQEGSTCTLEKAAIIRRWGTTKGLGELAVKGPLVNTVLDPCPTMYFHELTVIAQICCEETTWKNKL
jgi:hypothetical protein